MDKFAALPQGYEIRLENQRGYVGILEAKGQDHYVVLDKPDPRFGRLIKIARPDLNGAPLGMKVVVDLTAVLSPELAQGKIVLSGPTSCGKPFPRKFSKK